jgi:hypothetical protein
MIRSEPKWVAHFETGSAVSMQTLRPAKHNDHIAIGSRQTIRTVSLGDGSESLTPIRSMKNTTPTTCAAFHPVADSVIVAGGSNGEVSVWYYGAQNIAPLNDKWVAHSRSINGMDFLPPTHSKSTSNYLLTASADGELNLWDMCSYTGKRETWRRTELVMNCRPEGARSALRDLDCRLQDKLYEILVATDDGVVEFYRSTRPGSPTSITFHSRIQVSTQTINSVRFSPSGSYFATGGKDSYIRVYSIGSQTPVYSIRTSSSVWAVRWRPGGDFIAACQAVMDTSIYVWDLASRLMPAYVFNSHRDNVTDFFWGDRFHIMSCSRDNTVQLHQIKNAVIPIEKMRTVNISFGISSDGTETLSRLCSQINREKFEKSHGELEMGRNEYSHPTPTLPESSDFLRTLTMARVTRPLGSSPDPGLIVRCVPLVTKFIAEIARESTLTGCCGLIKELSLRLAGESSSLKSQAELVRLIGWLIGSSQEKMLELTFVKALEIFRAMNDLITILILGAVAIYTPSPVLHGLVSTSDMAAWSGNLMEILRRLQQHQLTTEFIFYSPFSEVRAFSHNKTGINLVSQCCKREREAGSENCSKCKSKLAECVLCGDTVKGLWVSCPGCLHGGHARHVSAWLEKHTVCPVLDCGHECGAIS